MSAHRIQLERATVDVLIYVRPSNSLRAELCKRLSGAKAVRGQASSIGTTCGVVLGHSHSPEEADRLATALGCQPDVAGQIVNQAGSIGMKHALFLRFCQAVGLAPFSEADAQLVAAAAADTLLPERTQSENNAN